MRMFYNLNKKDRQIMQKALTQTKILQQSFHTWFLMHLYHILFVEDYKENEEFRYRGK